MSETSGKGIRPPLSARIERAFSDLVDFLKAKRVEVSGPSMLPAFVPGDRLIVSRRSLRARPIERFEVVAVSAPDSGTRVDLKRVIGLPGETIILRSGRVFIDDAVLDEPFETASALDPTIEQEQRLGPDEYFVLGDNRVFSTDSRRYGPVPWTRILGRVTRRF